VTTASTIDDSTGTPSGVDAEPVAIVLTSLAPGARWPVVPGRDELHLGRRVEWASGAFELADERVSRPHATVSWQRGAWHVSDLGSHNGTFVDGQPVRGSVVVAADDAVLRIGHTLVLLVADGRGHASCARFAGAHVVGPELARVHAAVREHASADTLLVHGESGSGKELIARLYHDAGPRRAGPFVAVNCAAIPEGIAERLLFGARRGAFSGAADAAGYLADADGGTLFLDEIADLDAAVQGKLLRALEAREVTPLGASAPIAVDVGVVAASHRELRAAVAEHAFRDDLYYRISRDVVYVPALRARRADLVELLVREIAARDPALTAHARLVETCCTRPWPGNIRELRAAVRAAASAARAAGRTVVRAEDLPGHAGQPFAAPEGEPAAGALRADPAALDRAQVVAALSRAGGVVSVAARTLGLHRTQLYRLLEKLAIERDDT
jgi:transcriptional regulator with PAS, ATPase and Fis domain